jgi:uridylate kinase
VVIFAGGTGKPFFTTDTAAARRAAEVGAQVIIKAGPADAVYSADPARVRTARKFATLTVRQALKHHLGFMDEAALKLCAKTKVPIVVCRWARGTVAKVVRGAQIGTTLTV